MTPVRSVRRRMTTNKAAESAGTMSYQDENTAAGAHPRSRVTQR